MSTPLFVVVREDRHFDPEITVHSTRELADAAIEEFKARYTAAGDRYTWEEQTYGRPKWLRYVDCFEDGPNARIEAATLDGGS